VLTSRSWFRAASVLLIIAVVWTIAHPAAKQLEERFSPTGINPRVLGEFRLGDLAIAAAVPRSGDRVFVQTYSSVFALDAATGNILWSLYTPLFTTLVSRTLACSSDGSLVAVCCGAGVSDRSTLLLIDGHSGEVLANLTVEGWITSVAMSDSGNVTAIAAFSEHRVYILNASGAVVAVVQCGMRDRPRSVAVLPNGSLIAITCYGPSQTDPFPDAALRVVNASGGEVWRWSSTYPNQLALTSVDIHEQLGIVCGGYSASIQGIESTKLLVFNLSGELLWEDTFLGWVYAVDIAEDASWVVAADLEAGTLRGYLPNGSRLFSVPMYYPLSVCALPSQQGCLVAATEGAYAVATDGSPLWMRPLIRHTAVAASPNLLVAVDEGGTVIALNSSFGELWQRIVGCKPPVIDTDRALTRFIASTPERTLIYVENVSGTYTYMVNYATLFYEAAIPYMAWTGFRAIRSVFEMGVPILNIVDPYTNQTVCEISPPVDDPLASAVLTPEGLYVVVGTEQGSVLVYSAYNGSLLEVVNASNYAITELYSGWFGSPTVAITTTSDIVFLKREDGNLSVVSAYAINYTIYQVHASTDAQRVFVICADGTVLVFQNAQLVGSWQLPEPAVDTAIAWYTNSLIALASEEVLIFNATDGSLEERIPLSTTIQNQAPQLLAASWDAQYLYIATNNSLWLIDEQRNTQLVYTTTTPTSITWLRTSPSGGRVLLYAEFDAIYLLSVLQDHDQPALTITQPQDTDLAAGTPIVWIASDASTWIEHSEVVVDNLYCIDTDTATELVPPYQWVEGWHNLTLRVFDAVGYQKQTSFRTYLDTTPPTITILEPQQGLYYNKTSILVKWNASDNREIRAYDVYVNASLAATLPPSSTTTFIKLHRDGNWNITVIAYDRAGNQGQKSVIIVRDTEAPDIEVLSPANNSIVQEPYLTIRWLTKDEFGIKKVVLYIDKDPIGTVTPEGYLVLEIPRDVDFGTHVISFEAVDLACNTRFSNIIVLIESKSVEEPIQCVMLCVLLLISLSLVAWHYKKRFPPKRA